MLQYSRNMQIYANKIIFFTILKRWYTSETTSITVISHTTGLLTKDKANMLNEMQKSRGFFFASRKNSGETCESVTTRCLYSRKINWLSKESLLLSEMGNSNWKCEIYGKDMLHLVLLTKQQMPKKQALDNLQLMYRRWRKV